MTSLVLFLMLFWGHGRPTPHNPHNQPSCGKVWSHGRYIYIDCNAPAPVTPL